MHVERLFLLDSLHMFLAALYAFRDAVVVYASETADILMLTGPCAPDKYAVI